MNMDYLSNTIDKRCLNSFAKNYQSQFGEDGIIEEIFKRLGITKGWTVEFGAMDGGRLSNTYHLIEQNDRFRGVFIEGDSVWFDELNHICSRYPKRMIPVCKYVQPTGVDSLQYILSDIVIPKEFELLSIDVDGMDYQIWAGFKDYSPKVVIIEINSSFLPDVYYINGFGGTSGTSFRSMLELGKSKGYTLVCHTGNMFFVRNNLVEKLDMDRELLDNPSMMFNDFWIQNSVI